MGPACGDGSVREFIATVLGVQAPRMRGWSEVPDEPRPFRFAGPAYAGMARPGSAAGYDVERMLRVRGDGPHPIARRRAQGS